MIVSRITAGLLFLTAVAMAATGASAAELKLLSVEAMKPALQELTPAFEADSKHKLKVEYAAPEAIEKKITSDEDYDVVILDKPRVDKLYAAANVAGARSLFVAIPQAFEAGQIVYKARAANPDLVIVARAHGDAEVEHLKAQGATAVIMGENEIARGMVESTFELIGEAPPAGPA